MKFEANDMISYLCQTLVMIDIHIKISTFYIVFGYKSSDHKFPWIQTFMLQTFLPQTYMASNLLRYKFCGDKLTYTNFRQQTCKYKLTWTQLFYF